MDEDIYSNPMIAGLFGSFFVWGLGLLFLIGGFIFVTRILIGRRLEQATRELRALEETDAEARKAAGGSGPTDTEKDRPR